MNKRNVLEASVFKITNKYELVYWVYGIKRNAHPMFIAKLIERAKGKSFVVWRRNFGFKVW